MNAVSLVRVESEWHVFANSADAWDFYTEWSKYRDCECLLEVGVQAELP